MEAPSLAIPLLSSLAVMVNSTDWSPPLRLTTAGETVNPVSVGAVMSGVADVTAISPGNPAARGSVVYGDDMTKP